jgi:uncharacterized protein
MRKIVRHGLLVAALIFPLLPPAATPLRAQSFSCEMAHTKDEEAVCRSRWLRRLDAIMAEQYQALKKHMRQQRAAHPAQAAQWRKQLAKGQQAFVARRAECDDDAACIGKVYEDRILELVRTWKRVMR